MPPSSSLLDFLTSDKALGVINMAAGGVLLALVTLSLKMVQDWLTRRAARWRANSDIFQAEKQVACDQTTERICLESRADHVSVYRLHNGEYFEGNDSIKKLSMYSEALHSNYGRRWKKKSQNMLMGDFPHLRLGISKQPIYWMRPTDVLDFEAERLMSERGYGTRIALVIKGKNSKALGILMLSWQSSTIGPADIDPLRLEEYRKDLSFLLSA